jgi:hypothetical protein
MSAFNEPSFAKLLYRERALYRTAHSLVDQWAESPELLSSYPEICRGAPFVSPNSAVRATIRIVEPTTGDEGEAQEDDARAINVLAITRQERDRRLATLHEAVPESMAGAREALTAKGPDFAAKCAVCLRRALETTLDVVAPSKAVSVWQDPKLKMRGDGNGPTRASRLHFAFRNLPKNHRAARFVEADVMMTEALMETINPTIHRPGGERDVEQLDIYVQRMEIVLLVLASLPRE